MNHCHKRTNEIRLTVEFRKHRFLTIFAKFNHEINIIIVHNISKYKTVNRDILMILPKVPKTHDLLIFISGLILQILAYFF